METILLVINLHKKISVLSLIFLCGLIKIIAKTHAKLYNVFVGEIMFDIDELKKLKELENQTVHCL